MTVRVLLFAGARARAGRDRLELELPAGATVAQARRALAGLCPALGGLLDKGAIAVNEEVADDGDVIPEGAELALLPPVSGG
jgi:molybdopterin converting factor subunit 1